MGVYLFQYTPYRQTHFFKNHSRAHDLISLRTIQRDCVHFKGLDKTTVESNIEISSFGWGTGFQCMLVGFPMKGTGAEIMTNTDMSVHQLKGLIGEVVAAAHE